MALSETDVELAEATTNRFGTTFAKVLVALGFYKHGRLSLYWFRRWPGHYLHNWLN